MLTKGRTFSRKASNKHLLIITSAAVIGLGILLVGNSGPVTAQNSELMSASEERPHCITNCTFDVASVRPSKPGTLTSVSPSPSGYSARAMSVRALLCSAYDLKMCSLISGLPGWADSDRFDIQAKMDDTSALAFRKLPENEQLSQLRFMLQGLLAERFNAKLRHQPKDIAVYSLVIDRSGSKLKEASANEATNMMVGQEQITATATTTEDLIGSLSDIVGRVVVDRTGLSGKYDFVLRAKINVGQGDEDSSPSVYSALPEQLGLRLIPARAPVDSLVVDSISKPTEN